MERKESPTFDAWLIRVDTLFDPGKWKVLAPLSVPGSLVVEKERKDRSIGSSNRTQVRWGGTAVIHGVESTASSDGIFDPRTTPNHPPPSDASERKDRTIGEVQMDEIDPRHMADRARYIQ